MERDVQISPVADGGRHPQSLSLQSDSCTVFRAGGKLVGDRSFNCINLNRSAQHQICIFYQLAGVQMAAFALISRLIFEQDDDYDVFDIRNTLSKDFFFFIFTEDFLQREKASLVCSGRQ